MYLCICIHLFSRFVLNKRICIDIQYATEAVSAAKTKLWHLPPEVPVQLPLPGFVRAVSAI